MAGGLAQLPKLEQAKALLAECTRVDEAKHFHDVAEAARQYARMNGLGLDAQNLATEIKIRAGRRAGELLKATERRHRGGDQSCIAASGCRFAREWRRLCAAVSNEVV